MSNKLQELTDKLYNEGLSKGKAEGEQLVAEAKKKAGEIVDCARAEAEAILANAVKEAEDLKAKAASDIRMASTQALQATRKDIEYLLVGNLCDAKVKEACKDPDFIKEVIKSVAGGFSAQESKDLELVLPENLRSNLEPWVKSELSKALASGIKADFSKKIQGGFTIGPADGSYFVSFTDETFKELISEYLRPVTKKLLFG